MGDLPGLTRKVSNKPNTPGQHGQLRSKLVRNMSLRLLEKQKLRFNYNITERQLLRYVIQAKKSTGSTGEVLLEL
jgi:small subunit ribosomal protein S4